MNMVYPIYVWILTRLRRGIGKQCRPRSDATNIVPNQVLHSTLFAVNIENEKTTCNYIKLSCTTRHKTAKMRGRNFSLYIFELLYDV